MWRNFDKRASQGRTNYSSSLQLQLLNLSPAPQWPTCLLQMFELFNLLQNGYNENLSYWPCLGIQLHLHFRSCNHVPLFRYIRILMIPSRLPPPGSSPGPSSPTGKSQYLPKWPTERGRSRTHKVAPPNGLRIVSSTKPCREQSPRMSLLKRAIQPDDLEKPAASVVTNICIFEYIRIYLLTNIRIRIYEKIFANIRKYSNILLFIVISSKIVDFLPFFNISSYIPL